MANKFIWINEGEDEIFMKLNVNKNVIIKNSFYL